MTDKKSQKVAKEYHCEKCDYITCKTFDWKKHLKTKKHQRLTNTDVLTDKKSLKVAHRVPFVCECGKSYKHRQSLYSHKKRCYYNDNDDNCSIISSDVAGIDKDELILKLLAQNGELINALKTNAGTIGQNIDHGMGITGNNNNQIQNNFNIQLYLNEDCKNAASIQDFAKQLKLTMEDLSLMKVNEPKAMVNIITKNLKDYTQYERPIHHHEKKWYIKDKEEGWDKEGETDGVKLIEHTKRGVSQKASAVFVENNPDWLTNQKKGEDYAETVAIAMKDISPNNSNEILKTVKSTCSAGK
jgi:hypothetical protein